MPINNTTPVIVPAVSATPELEYDQLWLTNIVIEARDQTVGQISIQAVPYSTLSGAFADIPRDLLLPDYLKERRLLKSPEVSDTRAITMSVPSQEVTPKFVDDILMKIRESKSRGYPNNR